MKITDRIERRVDPVGEAEQLRHELARDVRLDRLADGRGEDVDVLERLADVELLAERDDDALLARGALEVGRALARPRVPQRLGAGHVLDAGRDVEPQRRCPWSREVVVEDRHLDVDGDAAEGVHDLPEAVEVDLDVVLDVEPVQVAEDRLEAVVARGYASSCCRGTSRRDCAFAAKLLILPG